MKKFKVWKIVGIVKTAATEDRQKRTGNNVAHEDRRTVLLLAQNYEEAHDNAREALEHNWSNRTVGSDVRAITPVVNEKNEQLEVHLSDRSWGVR